MASAADPRVRAHAPLVVLAGIVTQGLPGIYFAVGALAIGNATQLLWLRRRARPLLRALSASSPGIPAASPGVS